MTQAHRAPECRMIAFCSVGGSRVGVLSFLVEAFTVIRVFATGYADARLQGVGCEHFWYGGLVDHVTETHPVKKCVHRVCTLKSVSQRVDLKLQFRGFCGNPLFCLAGLRPWFCFRRKLRSFERHVITSYLERWGTASVYQPRNAGGGPLLSSERLRTERLR